MGSTKKVGSTGRFGSRYGVGIRKKLISVEKKQNKLSPCPFCGFSTVKREAAGLFFCKKCSNKFAGGAYEVQTLVGKTVAKMVSQKSFAAESKLLLREQIRGQEDSSFSDIEREVEESLVKEK